MIPTNDQKWAFYFTFVEIKIPFFGHSCMLVLLTISPSPQSSSYAFLCLFGVFQTFSHLIYIFNTYNRF